MAHRLDSFSDFWPPEADPTRRGPEARAASGPASTPAMRRAEETNRVAREAIDKDTEKRLTLVAKLRAQRLEKAAADAAEAAAAPQPARKPRRKAAGTPSGG